MTMLNTPFYFYDLDLLRRTLEAIKTAMGADPFYVHYAMKANIEPRVLELIRSYGFGVDCVSGGEIRLALKSGFKPEQIVLAGVGKTDEELQLAISEGVHCINCESIEELEVINSMAVTLNMTTSVSFRLNPNIDARTHPNITTGKSTNKFGIPASQLWQALDQLEKFPRLKFIGLHFHIGSQITDTQAFRELCDQINDLQNALTSRGYNPETLNVGGGLGIDYVQPERHPIPPFNDYFDVFRRHLNLLPRQQVHFELGRSIVGQMGSLISRVLYVKHTSARDFVILDAGMSDMMRPALYQARHKVENLSSDGPLQTYEVVGPICESTDTFFERDMNETYRGDIVRIWSTGAYGSVLSSDYNLRLKNAPLFSDDAELPPILMSLFSKNRTDQKS